MGEFISTFGMLIILFAVFYFLMIRPENKRKKKMEEMRNNLHKGDIITTIGGVVGRIVKIEDESIIIETSEDRVRMEFVKWAVASTGVVPENDGKKKKNKKDKNAEEEQPAAIEETSEKSDENQ